MEYTLNGRPLMEALDDWIINGPRTPEYRRKHIKEPEEIEYEKYQEETK